MPSVFLSRDGPGSLAAMFPYSTDVNAVMRDLPGREYVGARRIWKFPLTPENVLQLYDRLKVLGWGLVIPPDVRAELRGTADAVRDAALVRKAGDSDIAWPLITTPYAHQRAALSFLLTLGSGALLHEMGLGKTASFLAYAETLHQREHDAVQGSSGKTGGTATLGATESRQAGGLSPRVLPDSPGASESEGASLPSSAPRAHERDGAAVVAPATMGDHARRTGQAGQAPAWPLRGVPAAVGDPNPRRPRPRDGSTAGPAMPAVQSRDRVAARQPGDHATGCPVCGFRVLVIAPNTVIRNWGNEIEKHAGHTDYVIPRGTLVQRAAALGAAVYTIINCEALSHKVMADALKAIEWSITVADESTRFKTPKAARTKTLHKLKAARRVILTGTPITGKPQDAWSQFEFVSPGLFGPRFWSFEQRYLHKDFFGNVDGLNPGTADELRAKIDSRGYRILKADVLDLPPKVYTDRRVTLGKEQAALYAQMRDELRIEIEGNPKLTANNILTMLLRLTQITAGLVGSNLTGYRWLEDGAKVTELDALLDELGGEQVVIFGLYQRELEALAARYGDPAGSAFYNGIIYGPTPEKDRHTMIEQFQAGQRRLLFAQVRTGGIGINLTAARTAIYYTRSWGLEEYLQSQDRLHRIGQTGTVSIVHLVAEGTIDDDIAAAIIEKQQLADTLTGDGARKLAAQVLGRSS